MTPHRHCEPSSPRYPRDDDGRCGMRQWPILITIVLLFKPAGLFGARA